MKSLKHISLSLSLLTVLSFTGCGGGGSNTPNNPTSEGGKKILGDVTGNGYASNNVIQRFLNNIITPLYADNLNKPDKIVVMYDKGRAKEEFPINADGSFEIDTSLFDKNDLVVFVVNSATKTVYGHLNLDADSNNKLDFIDKSKLQSDLDLGSIDTESNCSSSTTLNSTTAFSSDELSKLQKIAISDNALILYKNKYVNPDYDAEIQVLYSMDAINDIKGTWSNINNFDTSKLIGLRPTVKTHLSSYNNISENQIYLYPPTNVNYTTNRDGNFNQTASSSNPLPSTYKGTNDGNFYEFAFVNNFPQGDWNLKIDGDSNIKGKFNFSSAYPFDSNGKSIVPVPQIKLNKDPNDNTKLKSI